MLIMFVFFLILVYLSSFSVYSIPSTIFCNVGLVVLNCFNLYLSLNVFIFSLVLKDNFAGYSNCSLQLFFVRARNTSVYAFLVFRIFAEKPAVTLLGLPL
jgi:hypothetical protein